MSAPTLADLADAGDRCARLVHAMSTLRSGITVEAPDYYDVPTLQITDADLDGRAVALVLHVGDAVAYWIEDGYDVPASKRPAWARAAEEIVRALGAEVAT